MARLTCPAEHKKPQSKRTPSLYHFCHAPIGGETRALGTLKDRGWRSGRGGHQPDLDFFHRPALKSGLGFPADMAKLVDAPDLGSGAARHVSSSLSIRTKTHSPPRPVAWRDLGRLGPASPIFNSPRPSPSGAKRRPISARPATRRRGSQSELDFGSIRFRPHPTLSSRGPTAWAIGRAEAGLFPREPGEAPIPGPSPFAPREKGRIRNAPRPRGGRERGGGEGRGGEAGKGGRKNGSEGETARDRQPCGPLAM